MRILLAFDKFKDALTAPAACAAAAAALREAHPEWALDSCPLTDGGEGFCEILTHAVGGEIETHVVTGPRGAPTRAQLGFAPIKNLPAPARALLGLGDDTGDHRIAIVEMAAASGLALLPSGQRDPWRTTSLGTGELLRLAARPGVALILLGVGGSATSDLGLGALSALGLECRTGAGELVSPPIPARWPEIVRFTGQVADGLPPIRIACDVANPLLGPTGAAAVYGPQKGLRAADLPRLDHEAARLALLLCHHGGQSDALMDLPGTGAAGGISFGLMATAGAQLLPGFDLVTAWLGLEARLATADLVLTGEGRFDQSSLSGKGPGAVALRARALAKPAHVFAGAVTAPPSADAGLALHAITPAGMPLAEALRDAGRLLTSAVRTTFSAPR